MTTEELRDYFLTKYADRNWTEDDFLGAQFGCQSCADDIVRGIDSVTYPEVLSDEHLEMLQEKMGGLLQTINLETNRRDNVVSLFGFKKVNRVETFGKILLFVNLAALIYLLVLLWR